jgi:hypothetical protein
LRLAIYLLVGLFVTEGFTLPEFFVPYGVDEAPGELGLAIPGIIKKMGG